MDARAIDIRDYPICQRCGHKVLDFLLIESDNTVYLVIECHRSMEIVTISPEELKSMDLSTINLKPFSGS